MKNLLIFTLTVFGLNTAISQTNEPVQKNYLISDTSKVLSSVEKVQTSNLVDPNGLNINSYLQNNITSQNFENKDLQNNSSEITTQPKEKNRPFLKKLKNHSFFPEQFALKMPHM